MENLSQTIRSISNQNHPDWRGIIVANDGANLPQLPDKFEVVRVSFPPNVMHEKAGGDKNDFLDAFRVDKGRRVLKGMLHARDSRFFMIVDDDDFVSSHIVDHVAKHQDSNGWTIDKGYVWDDGGKFLYEHNDFNHLCGTSLIIRSDHYGLPESYDAASIEWIKTMLGSHIRIREILKDRQTPLSSLPFRGAVYRVAHAGSHSMTPSLLHKYFLNRSVLFHPFSLLKNILKLRFISETAKRDFFGKK
ncbi:hypothetical protein [Sodalis sp. RH20]|uniref:hypothetical protein n=1 Tax=unclassified Sodalis (in: enterobacteria) TaxID=2636512 RepID=UPI0039B608F3